MLRVRACIASHLLSFPSTSAISSPRRLSAAAAPAISPNPGFAVEEYLVDSCGLTRAQALRASSKISHLKSPLNPDAVLAFLADLGLSSAAVVARDPNFLCAKVDKTLASSVAELTALGLSRSEIARLVSLSPSHFRRRSIVSIVQYYLTLFGSSGNLLRVLERNIVFLRQCGLGACEIAKLCIDVSRMLSTKPERVRAMVACAEGIGVPRGSGMFRQALQAVAFLSEEKIAAKMDYLQKTFMWSDAEVSIALKRFPRLLQKSKDMLRRRSEFFISEVGLEPAYIAHNPVIISFSMEGRLRPRHYVLKFLKEKGLLDRDWSFATVLTRTDDVFMEKYICPYKEVAPQLAEDYAAACRGEVPTNFQFT